MSGTSADGVDVALLEVETLAGPERQFAWEMVDFISVPYGDAVRAEILVVQESGDHVLERITRLHFVLGNLFADAVERLATDAGHDLSSIDLVASHGQTVCHFPRLHSAESDAGMLTGSEAWGSRDEDGSWVSPATLQIGEPAVIAERTGISVMSNFRSRDVAAGGTGAPLVPRIDHLLYADPAANRVALNIGGIANLTSLPAGVALEDVTAFDTGPGNMILDGLVHRLTEGKQRYDEGGAQARRGTSDEAIVEELMADPFFSRTPPKAAGRGEFGADFVERLHNLGNAKELSQASLLATAVSLTTRAVRDAVDRFLDVAPTELIVSGGGAHNVALLESLAARFPEARVVTSDYYGLDVDAKEAAAFALLAHLSLEGLAGNIPRVTGARHPVILGDLTPGGTGEYSR